MALSKSVWDSQRYRHWTSTRTLFANFFGTVVTLWALLRLLRTEAAFGRYDAVGRFAFALWMILALANGATPLLYGFLAVEIGFAIAQALPIRTPEGTRSSYFRPRRT